ncbi:serine/threonine-protein kinase [Streptomyces sp. BI20]|uniref:serine/threonine-protein kinase n=1 Tax=Streptomyces sp. BI20 TaxID=3403460 RepID=UPI003C708B3C
MPSDRTPGETRDGDGADGADGPGEVEKNVKGAEPERAASEAASEAEGVDEADGVGAGAAGAVVDDVAGGAGVPTSTVMLRKGAADAPRDTPRAGSGDARPARSESSERAEPQDAVPAAGSIPSQGRRPAEARPAEAARTPEPVSSTTGGTTVGRLLAGRYRLESVLGKGGMGTVWRATDETLGRVVAVKELRFGSGVDEDEKRRLVTRTLREAKAIARIRSGGAVTVYDVVDEDARPWIVMELIEGPSLAEYIREHGPLSPRRAAEVGLAVLDVLKAAHDQGILHRDVKPSNVLIAENGRVVLTDFGIAQVEGDPSITSTGMLVGAPSYIAPERARGRRPGPPSDLWSLGGLLYAATEGHPPYDKGSALATLTAVMTEQVDPPRNAGPVADVIYGLLRKDPEHRLDDAGTRALLNTILALPEPGQARPGADDVMDATRMIPIVSAVAAAEHAEARAASKAEAKAKREQERRERAERDRREKDRRDKEDREKRERARAALAAARKAAAGTVGAVGAAAASVGGATKTPGKTPPGAAEGVASREKTGEGDAGDRPTVLTKSAGAGTGSGSGAGAASGAGSASGSGGGAGTGAGAGSGSGSGPGSEGGAADGGEATSAVATKPPGRIRRVEWTQAPLTDVVARRTLVLVGVGVLVALALVVWGIVAAVSGSDEEPGGGGKTDGKGVVSPAPVTPGGATGGSPAPNGGNGGTSQKPGTTPGTGTGDGSGSGSGTGVATPPALPAGYRSITNTEFRFGVAVPAGFEQTGRALDSGAIYSKGGGYPRLQIDHTDSPTGDARLAWLKLAPAVAGSSSDYKLLDVRRVNYRDYPTTADWEFERTENGKTVRVLNRGFKIDAKNGYAIMITCEKSAWDAADCAQLRTTAFDTFRPLG